MQDEHKTGLEIYAGDQPVVITMNVEDSPPPHHVRVPKISPHVNQGAPLRTPDDPVPVHQRGERIRIHPRENENRLPADYPHRLSLHSRNWRVKGMYELTALLEALADRFVLRLLNQQVFSSEDFHREEGREVRCGMRARKVALASGWCILAGPGKLKTQIPGWIVPGFQAKTG